MSSNNCEYPKIRYVDAIPVQTERGQMFGLRDPGGIATDMILLSPDVYYLLQFFDGSHSQLDIRNEYYRAFGNFLFEEQLSEVLRNLDTQLFLDNDNFVQKRKAIEQEFLNSPVREASHAGQSYESDPVKLGTQLDQFFKNPEGAGPVTAKDNGQAPKGLVAPHIDIRAGGPCYTHAYKALAESEDVDCFVILGTGHSGLENLYSTLAKDFETPFGRAKCDLEFIETLNSNYDTHPNEILPHKSEHTIEFQLIFLQHLFQNKRDFTFVPILCSFSYHMLNGSAFPREKKIVENFSRALKKTIAEFGKKVCLITSVDFSHVGPRFGDPGPADDVFLKGVEQADKELFAKIELLDLQGFQRSVENNRDCYRVCGFSPIYTLLKTIDAERGALLNYSNTQVDEHKSTVTFASMVFH